MPTGSERLSGRVALVTGANRGIGEAVVSRLGDTGAYVVGTATSPEGARKIDEDLEAAGIPGFGVELNLAQHKMFPERLATIAERAGQAVTILINNAGITRDNLALKMTPEEWIEVINVDLNGPALLTLAALRAMLKAKQGDVVSVGSVVGTIGEGGQANYAAAKSGLVGFTKSLAKEYGHKGLRFNVVAPGLVDTDMTRKLPEERIAEMKTMIPLGRHLTPSEVAEVIVDTIDNGKNGEVIAIDGGLTPDSLGPISE